MPGEIPAYESYQPIGQEGYHFLSGCLHFGRITASQSSVLFAHRCLPMGKKRITLCVLCVSSEAGGEILVSDCPEWPIPKWHKKG